jgi:hypothetical protein
VLSVVRKAVALWLSGSAETVNALVNSESARLALKQVRSIRVFRSKYGRSLPAFYGAFLSHLPLLSPGKPGPASRTRFRGGDRYRPRVHLGCRDARRCTWAVGVRSINRLSCSGRL